MQKHFYTMLDTLITIIVPETDMKLFPKSPPTKSNTNDDLHLSYIAVHLCQNTGHRNLNIICKYLWQFPKLNFDLSSIAIQSEHYFKEMADTLQTVWLSALEEGKFCRKPMTSETYLYHPASMWHDLKGGVDHTQQHLTLKLHY